MLNNPIKNDPLAMVWTAFKNLYPDQECDVWYDLHSNSGNNDGFAFTEFPPDGGTPQAAVSAARSPFLCEIITGFPA